MAPLYLLVATLATSKAVPMLLTGSADPVAQTISLLFDQELFLPVAHDPLNYEVYQDASWIGPFYAEFGADAMTVRLSNFLEPIQYGSLIEVRVIVVAGLDEELNVDPLTISFGSPEAPNAVPEGGPGLASFAACVFLMGMVWTKVRGAQASRSLTIEDPRRARA